MCGMRQDGLWQQYGSPAHVYHNSFSIKQWYMNEWANTDIAPKRDLSDHLPHFQKMLSWDSTDTQMCTQFFFFWRLRRSSRIGLGWCSGKRKQAKWVLLFLCTCTEMLPHMKADFLFLPIDCNYRMRNQMMHMLVWTSPDWPWENASWLHLCYIECIAGKIWYKCDKNK